jgi:peptidoglycan biosynthesis protein MviN/MurJ (putative lipid II flippase)
VLLTTIAAAGLIVLADIPAWLLRLQGSAKETFAILLMIYALSIPFESITHLLLRSFYALKDTTTPAITTLLAASAAVTTAYVLVPSYDIFAIPIGYGVGQLTQTLLLCALPISRGYRLLKKSSS